MLQKAASRVDLGEETIVGVEIAGKKIALYLIGGQVSATDDECPHAGCLLSEEGVIEGEEVECSCHGSRFNVRTGENRAPPATEPLQIYGAEMRGDDVLVDIE